MMQILNHGPYTVNLLAEEASQSIVYAIMDGADAEAVWHLLKAPKPALAATVALSIAPLAFKMAQLPTLVKLPFQKFSRNLL